MLFYRENVFGQEISKISKLCHQSDEPVFDTKNGYGDMVIMSMETYLKLCISIRFIRTLRLQRRKLKKVKFWMQK